MNYLLVTLFSIYNSTIQGKRVSLSFFTCLIQCSPFTVRAVGRKVKIVAKLLLTKGKRESTLLISIRLKSFILHPDVYILSFSLTPHYLII